MQTVPESARAPQGNFARQPDHTEIRRALELLHPFGVVELRALFQRGRKRTSAGYFDPEHRAELIEAAASLNADGAAVYVNLNPLDEQLLSRYANRVEDYAQATATDANVTSRRWLLIDLDPVRPKDTSATNAQLEAAKASARGIYAALQERGWPKPAVAESGNGLHLLYRIDLPNDDPSRDLVKDCLNALAARFDDAAVKVDRSVFNAARIVKLYGTLANKGDNTPTAPWRLSRIALVPDELRPVPLELLQALAAEASPAERPRANGSTHDSGRAWSEADMVDFLTRAGLEVVGEPGPHDGAVRWKLRRCPFNPEHGAGEAAVFMAADGRLGFKCQHNGCADRHWADLRELVDGPRERRHSAGDSQRRESHGAPAAPTPLPSELPAVDPFDYELLPPVLRARVEDVAERMQCPPDYPAVALIVTLASVIGRRCGIRPKREDDWTVVPNLWGAIIGRPGVMKSPPLTEIMRPLQVLQARAIDIFKIEQTEHKASALVADEAERVAKDSIRKALKAGNNSTAHDLAHAAVESDNTAPVCRRYLVNDVTVEKLGEILNQNPNGLLLYRDELNGFFRTLERQGHEADRAFYLEAWNGDGSFTYDRIGRGTLHITGCCLSIIGSIQPGPVTALVRDLRGTGDDGLLQRFQLAVWPDLPTHWRNIDRPPDYRAADAVREVLERLDGMAPMQDATEPGAIRAVRFTSEAQELFDVWRASLETRLRGDSAHPMLEAHLAKYRSLIPSLALILHLTESPDGPVELEALERAVAWGEYLETHARRIYAPALAPDLDAARTLLGHLKRGDLGATFALRDIYNKGWTGLGTRDEAAAAVGVLADYDWLTSITEDTAGRPRTTYHVHPAINEGVA